MLVKKNEENVQSSWREAYLDEIGKISIGLVTTMTKNYVKHGIPLIRNSDIKPNKIKTELINLETEFANQHKGRMLKEGDIVTVHTGDVGVSAVIEQELEGALGFATLNTRIGNVNIINPYFLTYYFNSNNYKNFALRMSTGDGRNNLNLKDFKKSKVPIPPIKEQEKIVLILSKWDKAIELKEKFIEQKREQKKGLMQNLLTGNVRFSTFSGNWVKVKLEEIAEVVMGQSPPSKSYNNSEEGVPLIQGNADCKNRKTLPRVWTNKPSKKCLVGDIIMTVRAPVGYVSRSIHDACIGRGVCAIRSNINQDFLYYLLLSKENFWSKISQGSTFDSVNSKEIKSITLKIPPNEEQDQIAQVLKSCDKQIELLQSDLHNIKEQKKGLMQQLLTGKVRVKV